MTDAVTSGVPAGGAAGSLVTLFCAIVVGLYAAKRYNTPDTNRLTTTQSLFFATGAGYILASLLLFWLLSEILLKPGVLAFVGLQDAQEVIKTYVAPPILAAVILTTLLPNTILINSLDDWVLKGFQAWGRIPQGVRELADKLNARALQIADEDINSIKSWVATTAEIPNALSDLIDSRSADDSSGNLARTLRLYRELAKLESAPAYARAFYTRQADWTSLRDEFRVFAAQAQAFFLLFDELSKLEGPAGENAMKEAREVFQAIALKTWRRLAEFLAGLLLAVEGSDLHIQERAIQMGFIFEYRQPSIVGPLTFMGVGIVVAILAAIAAIPPVAPGPLPLPLTALLIGLTKTIGVVFAVLPKANWSSFRPDARGHLPYWGWLASACGATLIAFIVERAGIAAAHQTWSAGLDLIQYPITPLAPTTFAICVSTAILCDVDLHFGQGVVQRLTEGMLCGGSMALTIFVCTKFLQIQSATAAQTTEWFPYAMSFSIGFVAGFIAPHLYRIDRAAKLDSSGVGLRPIADVGHAI